MSDVFGKILQIATFGESHGQAVGVVVSGLPAGVLLDCEDIQQELDRRRPGQSHLTTTRNEGDQITILSGVFEGRTTGSALAMMVHNQDARPASYEHFSNVFRPSHADYTYQAKYGFRDWRGGGRASARETIGRVAAGAVARKILSECYDISIISWVSQIHDVCLMPVNQAWKLTDVEASPVRCPEPEIAAAMEKKILYAKSKGDSVGGVVSARITNVPSGLGEPVFDRLEADLAKAMLSIPASKGFDIGSGFEGVSLYGSKHNDSFLPKSECRSYLGVGTQTNHSGGVQGGISNGEDILFRVAFKPTATIFFEQKTVDNLGNSTTIKAKGRHDPCVVPRAVPIVDAMSALVLLDHVLRHETYHRFHPEISVALKTE